MQKNKTKLIQVAQIIAIYTVLNSSKNCESVSNKQTKGGKGTSDENYHDNKTNKSENPSKEKAGSIGDNLNQNNFNTLNNEKNLEKNVKNDNTSDNESIENDTKKNVNKQAPQNYPSETIQIKEKKEQEDNKKTIDNANNQSTNKKTYPKKADSPKTEPKQADPTLVSNIVDNKTIKNTQTDYEKIKGQNDEESKIIELTQRFLVAFGKIEKNKVNGSSYVISEEMANIIQEIFENKIIAKNYNNTAGGVVALEKKEKILENLENIMKWLIIAQTNFKEKIHECKSGTIIPRLSHDASYIYQEAIKIYKINTEVLKSWPN